MSETISQPSPDLSWINNHLRFLLSLKERKLGITGSTEQIVGLFLIKNGFDFMLTSANSEEGDLDFCLKATDRLTGEQVQSLVAGLPSGLDSAGIRGVEVRVVKTWGKNDGEEVKDEKAQRARTKYAPFENYLSAGVFSFEIRTSGSQESQWVKIDVISGYTLIDEIAKQQEPGTISIPDKGKKDKGEKEPIPVGAPKVDLSLVLTDSKFYEIKDEKGYLRGIKVLSRPLKGLKYLLEQEASQLRLKKYQKEAGQAESSSSLKEKITAEQQLIQRLEKNWQHNWQAWLKERGNDRNKALTDFVEMVADFLILQVQVSNLTSEQTDNLFGRLGEKLSSDFFSA